jgi:hypothetical protein
VSSFVPASPCPVGIGLLALRTDTLFTPAPKRDRSFYLISLSHIFYLYLAYLKLLLAKLNSPATSKELCIQPNGGLWDGVPSAPGSCLDGRPMIGVGWVPVGPPVWQLYKSHLCLAGPYPSYASCIALVFLLACAWELFPIRNQCDNTQSFKPLRTGLHYRP